MYFLKVLIINLFILIEFINFVSMHSTLVKNLLIIRNMPKNIYIEKCPAGLNTKRFTKSKNEGLNSLSMIGLIIKI
jgi:hypothetical protein